MDPSRSDTIAQAMTRAAGSAEPVVRVAQGAPGVAATLPRAQAASGGAAQDDETTVRLGLQRSAPGTRRRHLFRVIRRFMVLVVADLAAFGVMRELLRSLRDQAALGGTLAASLRELAPRGMLNGTQYAFALVIGLLVTGNYGRGGDRRRDPRRLFLACALATALPLWMRMWTDGVGEVLTQYVLTTALVWVGLVMERLTLDRLVVRVAPPANHAARTLLVGRPEHCHEAERSPALSPEAGYRSVGIVDVRVPPAPEALGHVGEFARVLHHARAETVVLCGTLPDGRLEEVVDATLTAGCQLLSVPRQFGLLGVEPGVMSYAGYYLIELSTPSLRGWQLFFKRLFDLVAGTLTLLVTAPLMLVVAAAIKLDSRGPVFFRQERLGLGGRMFRVWKFRTMVEGASDAAHRDLITRMLAGDPSNTAHTAQDGAKVYKLVRDDRVTRVGGWLRRLSLDELPQLFNVIAGHMSLVGPRPPLAYEAEQYDRWQYGRLRVRPGITGLWQVSGRNLLSYRQMCELDMEYVHRWSLWLDLKILLRTVPVVLFNSGRAA
jgi:exopolysaccharide biosynthesis polyprenyl glycosylphosphotransferase